MEIGTACPIKVVANDSPVTKNELLIIGIDENSPNGVKFDFTSKSKRKNEALVCVGSALHALREQLKHGGIIMFFKSKADIGLFVNLTKECGLYGQVESIATIFNENEITNKKTTPHQLMLDYHEKCLVGVDKPAIMLAVSRGHLAECIDLEPEMVSYVIIVGTPFVNFGDVSVIAKNEYNNYRRKRETLTLERKKDPCRPLRNGMDYYDKDAAYGHYDAQTYQS